MPFALQAIAEDTNLSTPVSIANGGTSKNTRQAAIDFLLANAALAQGDIFIVDSSGNVIKLAKGNDNDILTMATNDPNWEAPSGGNAGYFGWNIGTTLGTTTLTYVNVWDGGDSTTEANLQVLIPDAFTWTKLASYVTVDNSDPDPTIKSRDDGVDGNLINTITGTGNFIDTSNSDSVSTDSLCNYVQGGESTSGSTTWRSIVSKFAIA